MSEILPALECLKKFDKWVAWKLATRDGKPTKLPVNPHTGGLAKVDSPTTWSNYEKAARRARVYRLAGVGFVITADDDLTGVDLDDVVDAETGKFEPWAAEIVALGETYCEISPSRTGLRMWIDGKVERSIKSSPLGIEIYRDGRYLTFTGNRVEGTPAEIRPAPKTLAALYEHLRDSGLPIRGHNNGPQFDDENSTPWQRLNSAALHDLDAWVPLLFENKYKYRNGRYRISSKRLGRDLEEDLSITPDGIVDWGVHDLGDPQEGRRTPIDLVIEHGRTNFWGAVDWLCEQLRRNPPTQAELEAAEDEWLWQQANPPDDSDTAKYWRGEITIQEILCGGERS